MKLSKYEHFAQELLEDKKIFEKDEGYRCFRQNEARQWIFTSFV